MIRRSACAALLGSALLLGAGCGTIHFDVSEGKRVKLLEQDAPTTVHVEETVWYALWGGVDLSDNHTAAIIDRHNLAEVKLHNTYSFWDSVINTFTSFLSFSRRRIVIDGNPVKEGP